MRGVTAFAVAVLAAVVLSACGAAQVASGPAPHVRAPGSGDIVFVAGGQSHAFGVDNTDLIAASHTGSLRDLTSTSAAESNAAWSADGSHVVFARQSTTGTANGGVRLKAGLFVWSPGRGAPRRIASCSKYCFQSEFAWSPNDRQLAFVSERGAIEVMNADGSGVHTVCDQARCGPSLDGPVWSPDGRRLAFSNGGMGPIGPVDLPSSIWVANADGSGVKRLTQANCRSFADERHHDCARDTAPAWSPDGRLIAFSHWRLDPFPPGAGPTGPNGPTGTAPKTGPTQAQLSIATSLEVMRADGSQLRSIYECRRGDWCDQTLPPAWSPDGKAIAYAPAENRNPSGFRITTLAGTTTTVHTCAGSHCLYPQALAWSPSGKQLAFFTGNPPASSAWVIDRDGAALHRIALDVQWGSFAWVARVNPLASATVPRVSTAARPRLSGTIAYDDPNGPDGHLQFVTLGAAGAKLLHGPRIAGLEPAWSPDGRQIAFGSTTATPNTNIQVADRNGRNVRTLTHNGGGATQPAWSPDGSTIAFVTDHGIGLVSAAGGRVRSLTSGNDQDPSWSPAGGELVFTRSARGETAALFTIRADGGGLKQLTNLPGEARSPVWSPDGKEIAFEWWTPAGDGLYLIRPDGTHLRRVSSATLPQGKPAWSPNGRYLAVISQAGPFTSSRILVIDVATGRVSPVASVPAESADPSWSSR